MAHPDCSNCGDAHPIADCTYVTTRRWCDDPAQNPDAPFSERRCETCAASEARSKRRERKLAEEGWI